jgi:hypothetical protein
MIRRPSAAAWVAAAIWQDTSIRLRSDHSTPNRRRCAAAEADKRSQVFGINPSRVYGGVDLPAGAEQKSTDGDLSAGL